MIIMNENLQFINNYIFNNYKIRYTISKNLNISISVIDEIIDINNNRWLGKEEDKEKRLIELNQKVLDQYFLLNKAKIQKEQEKIKEEIKIKKSKQEELMKFIDQLMSNIFKNQEIIDKLTNTKNEIYRLNNEINKLNSELKNIEFDKYEFIKFAEKDKSNILDFHQAFDDDIDIEKIKKESKNNNSSDIDDTSFSDSSSSTKPNEEKTENAEIITNLRKEMEDIYSKEDTVDYSKEPSKEDEYLYTEDVSERKINAKSKVYKALAFSLGAAGGFGLSFVPIPTTSGLIISGSRLVYSVSKVVIKAYYNKHKEDQDNKVVQVIDSVKSKINDKLEKHPKINAGVTRINNILKKKETQYFLNGLAVGYTAGKIYQGIDKLIKKNQEKAIDKVSNNKQTTNTNTNNNVVNQPENINPKPQTVQAPVNTPQTPNIDINHLDLSSLENGYVSSLDNEPVHLLNNIGKDVSFDKIRNGMIHFKQASGDGYAWFKVEDVAKSLNVSVDELTQVLGSGGMSL